MWPSNNISWHSFLIKTKISTWLPELDHMNQSMCTSTDWWDGKMKSNEEDGEWKTKSSSCGLHIWIINTEKNTRSGSMVSLCGLLIPRGIFLWHEYSLARSLALRGGVGGLLCCFTSYKPESFSKMELKERYSPGILTLIGKRCEMEKRK